jgi:hypothetical protein
MKDLFTVIGNACIVALTVFAFVGIFAGGGAIGRSQGKRIIHQEAVDRGLGAWKINHETGERSFEWTPATEGK